MQFVLSVEVSRLGTYAMLPNAFLTPRSLVPFNEVSCCLITEPSAVFWGSFSHLEKAAVLLMDRLPEPVDRLLMPCGLTGPKGR